MNDYINSLSALHYQWQCGVSFAVSSEFTSRYNASSVIDSASSKTVVSKFTGKSKNLSEGSFFNIDSNVADAYQQVENCGSLAELRDLMLGFEGCSLKSTAKNLVFADGNADSGLMLIGEAPGREEDLQGKPFVGRSGKLLDLMLHSIGLDRSLCYITNILPWRPPGNRTPSVAEKAICLPFLERHISLVKPRLLILLGGVACKEILQKSEGVMRLRGKATVLDGKRFNLLQNLPAISTLHPAYLLRQPAHKKLCWHDFLLIRQRWRDLGGSFLQ